jgi:diacylglycerol kinase (ATP)
MAAFVQIIATPGSGDGRARATARRLQKALVRRRYDARILTFTSLDRLLEWSATCAPAFSHLVGVGGDATLSAVAAAAVRLSVPFVPVPTGFGNMFAQAFGFASQTRRVMEVFERGQIRHVDVGTINGDHVFLSHRSYGLLEDVQQAVEQSRAQPRSRLLRHLAYYVAARRFLFTSPLRSIRVEVDGTLLVENAALVTVANVETYRGFLSLTPTASPLDGLFDIFAIPGPTKLGVWTRLFTLFFRMPGRWKGIVFRRGQRARVSVDGGAPEELAVRRHALPLLVLPENLEMLSASRAEVDAASTPSGAAASATPAVTEPRDAG